MAKRRSPTTPTHRNLIFRFFCISLLCLLSYLLGSNLHKKPSSLLLNSFSNSTADCFGNGVRLELLTVHQTEPFFDFEFHHSDPSVPNLSDNETIIPNFFQFCDSKYRDYCPCHDTRREKKFDTDMLFFRERHCPERSEKLRCLIPVPSKYRTPFRWPKSRDMVWFLNVPYKRLTETKADQNWVRLDHNKLVFPGGGTSFPGGAKPYIEEIAKFVPLRNGDVRTVLDVGCGVASFGAYLLDLDILTMSIAPRDIHHAQVQLALERGLPAMLGILSTYRLPYPSRSFDMVHCSRCLIGWTAHGGLHLMEIDRILRPGGYWVLSGPPISWRNSYKGWGMQPQELKEEQGAIEDLARRLCWKKIAEKGPIAVWRKATNHVHCIQTSKLLKSPPFCEATDPESAWYKRMELCITPLPKVKSFKAVAGGALEKWPKRLSTAPPRISKATMAGISTKFFYHDNQLWNKAITYYQSLLSSFKVGRYRNIMDMNAGLGGFGAALSKYPLWVMNVVPSDAGNNTLGIIYERGLIGTYMDWCEAFSTYPRTYDLIHANGVFSLYKDKCDMVDILLEMHRILRPHGAVIIRDHVDTIVKVKNVADAMRWQSRIAHTEQGQYHPDKLLVVNNSVKDDHSQSKRARM
ncbi:probable methyltransferase PMT19 [Amborella trichopoda]|uniref:Methyltransferase n=1 Tax=Amborella trichopoda TaxID=13333 RepID=U5D3E2_AMBTC|nr:probable methyltransferase PMT19 [Amborella trichopoda]ERN20101.1 hypothetical protein AMTR_s00066p00040550 [Amborella trichopoda]|eukprot:XP_006858634.1 probable methyltransferase PMT19 [Amborella trichopoda]